MPQSTRVSFRKIVQGINDTLDAVSRPLRVLTEYVENFTKGDIQSKITVSYKGDFNKIINNLNKYLDVRDLVLRILYKIAKGDLTTVVTPRSEKDVWGNALAQMLANLRQLASQMQEATENISKGQ